MKQEIIEKLAELEHQQFSSWTKYFLENLTEENIERWKRQINTPYSELTEKEKESDRFWARKILPIIFEEKISTQEITEIKTEIELSEIEIDANEITTLAEKRTAINNNSISLGILYLRCYEFTKRFSSIEKIMEILKFYEPEESFMNLIEDYQSESYGNNYISLRIIDYVREERERMDSFIELFFNIFSDQ
jgi:hypothetical protein